MCDMPCELSPCTLQQPAYFCSPSCLTSSLHGPRTCAPPQTSLPHAKGQYTNTAITKIYHSFTQVGRARAAPSRGRQKLAFSALPGTHPSWSARCVDDVVLHWHYYRPASLPRSVQCKPSITVPGPLALHPCLVLLDALLFVFLVTPPAFSFVGCCCCCCCRSSRQAIFLSSVLETLTTNGPQGAVDLIRAEMGKGGGGQLQDVTGTKEWQVCVCVEGGGRSGGPGTLTVKALCLSQYV